ncbi:helix-turn-helix domain-containing protein [Blastococcus sp. VKM Ac-2987]|uniref:helix-turn-helix domain-containing protein n=1 Tax=Blastococcus sp. VKM Ac-2987 TaxID=3004141 RepID=UPI003FA40A71
MTNAEIKSRFAAFMREQRTRRHMSKAEFARHLGVSRSELSRYEGEQVMPGYPRFIDICQRLKLDPGRQLMRLSHPKT